MSKECDMCKGSGYLRVRTYHQPLALDKSGVQIRPTVPSVVNNVKTCEACKGTGQIEEES